MIPESEIERIRRERSVLEFMPHPRRCGQTFVSLCPLPGHTERTASFYAYPDGGYKCYGCGRGGKDVIAFGYHYWDLSWPKDFPLVMVRLGARAGSTERTFTPPSMASASCRPDVLPALPDAASQAIFAAAAAMWQANLWKPTGHDARDYLRRRGLPDNLILHEGLGLSTGNLATELHRRGLSLDLAHALGLLRADGHEAFSERVVWCEWRRTAGVWTPLWATARLYGPGATWDTAPKYLNTRGDRVLGGLERASGAPEIAVVEGAFDRLALLSVGEQAVFLGSNDPPEPVLGELRQLAKRAVLYLVRDRDRAGRRGCWATIYKLNLPPTARLVVVDLPRGIKDPGELAEHVDGARLYQQAKRRGRVIDSMRVRRLCERCRAVVQQHRVRRRSAVLDRDTGSTQSVTSGA